MIEEGAGGRSGLTDWHLMDVTTMWTTVQDHETNGHWRHVTGWRRTSELALIHLTRLRRYREGLAEAWPPERSAASRAYLAELDQLIETVQHTHEAASANYTVLAAATSALSTTRHELKKIHQQYEETIRRRQAYEATPQPQPIPRAGRPGPAHPPVTDAEIEQLNAQARSLMYGLSAELHQAQAMLRQPPMAPRPKVDSGADIDSSGASAPVIPPIAPVPLVHTSPASTKRGTSPATRPVPMPAAPVTGPVLNSADAGLRPAGSSAGPIPGGASSTPPVGPTAPASHSQVVVPGSGLRQHLSAGTAPSKGNSTAGPMARSDSTGNAAPSATRPMPPGGLIGGTPGVGLGQPARGTVPPRQVNPVGGVIGHGGAGTGPAGAAGSRPGTGRGAPVGGLHGAQPSGTFPGSGSPLGRLGVDKRNEPNRRRDPDNLWETDQGVDPVVRPPHESGPCEPGPAIGFTR